MGADASVEVEGETVRVVSRQARTAAPDLLTPLTEASIDVTSFAVGAPSLEDVFMAITDAGDQDLDPTGESTGEDSDQTLAAVRP